MQSFRDRLESGAWPDRARPGLQRVFDSCPPIRAEGAASEESEHDVGVVGDDADVPVVAESCADVGN
jgi:hypothetical protein